MSKQAEVPREVSEALLRTGCRRSAVGCDDGSGRASGFGLVDGMVGRGIEEVRVGLGAVELYDPELRAIGAEVATLQRDVDEWRGGPLRARARVELLRGWLGLCRERLGAELQDVLAEPARERGSR